MTISRVTFSANLPESSADTGGGLGGESPPTMGGMRMLFDARYTRTSHHDGISRFGSELLSACADVCADSRGHIELIALIDDEDQIPMLPAVADGRVPWVKVGGHLSATEPLLSLELNRLSPDVVFSPMQTMGSWGRRHRLILTVHDLIYYEHPQPPGDLPLAVRVLWRLYHRAWWPQRLLLNRADAVVAVSETTAGLIRERRLTDRPIAVVPNAATPPDPAPSREPGHAARSLVYMGVFAPYKNVEALVRALAHLPGYTLHLASRIAPEMRARLSDLALEGAALVFHDGVSDAEYAELLDSATALVTASKAEGFGIPVVEAMSRGLPVAVSDLPIFREVTDGRAELFDADDPADIAAAVRRLEEPALWAQRSEEGKRAAARFSWRRSAESLLDLAEAVVADC